MTRCRHGHELVIGETAEWRNGRRVCLRCEAARQLRCRRGHVKTPENTGPDGRCLECQRIATAARRLKRSAGSDYRKRGPYRTGRTVNEKTDTNALVRGGRNPDVEGSGPSGTTRQQNRHSKRPSGSFIGTDCSACGIDLAKFAAVVGADPDEVAHCSLCCVTVRNADEWVAHVAAHRAERVEP
jgi:hypothetical protein